MVQEGIDVKQISQLKKIHPKSKRPQLLVKNFKIKKTLIKLNLGPLLDKVTDISYNNSKKLTLVKLHGIEKFLSLPKRKLVDQKVWSFNMNMGIFNSQITKKEILTTLQSN
jgi:hypothetical protein